MSELVSDWSCSKCTLDNPASVQECGACGAERPSGWVCGVCTLHNKTQLARCAACDNHRDRDREDAKPPLTSSKPRYWVCMVCTFENGPKRVVCQVAAVARGPGVV